MEVLGFMGKWFYIVKNQILYPSLSDLIETWGFCIDLQLDMYYHIGEADGLTRFGSWSCRVNVFILGGRGRG